jgi:ABC-type multidrug transport system permease subunit
VTTRSLREGWGQTLSDSIRVVRALSRRALNEILRVPGAAIPGILAPTIFLIGLTGAFGKAAQLPGFGAGDFRTFIVPVSILQGAGFTGAATGVNLARDIEQGWFDRLLVAPVARPLLVFGPILGAVTRCLVPATVVLVVGLILGAELPGGVPGLIALYVAAAGFCAVAGLWGVFMAVTFRTQQAGPLMQQGVFLAVFLSTAYTPQVLLRGWLSGAAKLNPVTHVLELARQATVSGIEPSLAHTLPGLGALLGLGLVFGVLAVAGLRRMGR